MNRGAWPVAAILAVGLMLAVTVSRRTVDYTPTSDLAVAETDVRVATQGRLLVGSYSRFGWHHPGPLASYAMAPFYLASGQRTSGLAAGALAVNLVACVVLLLVVGQRQPALALAAPVGAALALLVARVPDLLTSPWNPRLGVLPLAALVVTAAGTWSGRIMLLPVAAVLASLVAQAHVALVPVALAVGGAAGAGALWRLRFATPAQRRIAISMTVLVLALAWAPVLGEQVLTRPGGNLTALWTYFAAVRPRPSMARALSVWADMLSGVVRPDLYLAQGWPLPAPAARWPLAVAVAEVLALLLAVIRWRGRAFERALAALLLLATAVALWCVSRADREIVDHTVFWICGLGALNMAVLVALAIDALFARTGRALTLAATYCGPAVLGLAVGLGLWQMWGGLDWAANPPTPAKVAAAVAGDLERVLRDRGMARPLIHIEQDTWEMTAGVVLRLHKSGFAVRVDDDWAVMFASPFHRAGDEDVEVQLVGPAEHARRVVEGRQAVSEHDLLFAHLAP